MRTATPNYSRSTRRRRAASRPVCGARWLGSSFVSKLELQGVVRVACAGGRASPRFMRSSHPSGDSCPLDWMHRLDFEPTLTLAGTLPLRDLATRRRATKTAAQSQPQFCKSHLPKAHVLRQSRGLRTCPCASNLMSKLARLQLLLIGSWDTRWPRKSRRLCLWHELPGGDDRHETHDCHA